MWVIATSIFWTSLGVLLTKFQFIPSNLPKLLGRSLYWLGVPLQILALARRSDFSKSIWLSPIVTVGVLFLGLGLALLSLHLLQHQVLPKHRSGQGSFVLASMLGNTGFVGLAIVPYFVSKAYLAWVVLYGVTHNLLGSYGLGVFLASCFSKQRQEIQWCLQLRSLLLMPSLWAFALGWCSRYLTLPIAIEKSLQTGAWIVIPGAFLLIGMQLSKLQGLANLHIAFVPSALKMLVLPGFAGLVLTAIGITGDARFSLVLMSGMPTAFASVILAEEYNLDRQIAAGSIIVTTVLLPLTIPLWLVLFR